MFPQRVIDIIGLNAGPSRILQPLKLPLDRTLRKRGLQFLGKGGHITLGDLGDIVVQIGG